MTRAVLLDENIPRAVAEGLRAAGHDVVKVTAAAGIDDRAVLKLAREGGRILLTFDSDFGELIFRQGEPPPAALLYFRVHPIISAEILALALHALANVENDRFVVVTREGLRSRPFDGQSGDERGS